MELLSISPLSWFDLGIAMISGILIGSERQYCGKPAGMRTSALICLSTYLFVAVTQSLEGDQLRVVGQIITGVGFLGGGVIISKEGVVQGMTSASVIWILAAIGAVIGLGYPLIGIKITVVTLIILWGLNYLERHVRALRKGVHRSRFFKK